MRICWRNPLNFQGTANSFSVIGYLTTKSYCNLEEFKANGMTLTWELWWALLSLLLMVAGARAHWGTPGAVQVLLIWFLCRHPGRERGKEAAEEWCGWICCSHSWPGAAEPCTQTTIGNIRPDSGPVTGASQTVLGTPWSNEGAGYGGLLMTDHLVSLSKVVMQVCVCGQNSLWTSVGKL